ncbi:ABC transporter ATP-binding protein [Acetobacter cerevisiae]|uniref:ABC transporter ATP-binding protein n=1 Tax=Acetobacter cerevisiae TaxID=178900 RepID=A0A149UZC4_9PROT|nr:ABC transporter ATP-binding protein [Acetobacter cerevisiae]KXV73245.1 ferrichrome ABC transporter ATP-binding protein [Acetobacter cerevisiae]MCP1244712.1 ABC transporter ATP-binding protein [Acetobacter cerevisiae]MCP1254289.1 ABC transporter ATP-binding protein [Acetobacter cerevisiae]
MTCLLASDVSLSLGGRHILRSVTMSVQSGAVVGLIGPNGAGKSSLLRLLAGLKVPDTGCLLLDDQNLASVPAHWRARQIAFMPQEIVRPPPMSVRHVAALGRLAHGESGSVAFHHPKVTEALEQTGLLQSADRPAHRLSGGELARLSLCRMLCVDAPVLLADEPVAALDPAHALMVMSLFQKAAHQDGKAVVVVLHDLALAARFCDQLVLMQDGAIRAHGLPEDVLAETLVRDVYQVTTRRIGTIPVPWDLCP